MSDALEQAQEASEPTVEDRAREMGWRPKEEYKGDEARWVDADTFVKRGEEVLPIVRASLKKSEDEKAALKAEMAEMKRTFKEFKVHHSQTERRAYERAIKELEARQEQAVKDNNLGAVREITREMAELSRDVQTDASGDPYASADHARVVSQWKTENTWYGVNAAMTGAANAVASELEQQGVTGAEQLQEVSKRIRAEFPQHFQNERRQAPAAVEGAAPPRKGGGKTRSDLPPEARATMDRWVKQGLVTEAQYLKDYFA